MALPISRRSVLRGALLHGALAAGVAAHPSAAREERLPRPGWDADVIRAVDDAAEPLPGLDDPAFGRVFDRFGGSQVVLLGESTHGTHEFHRARTAITRRLVEHHGFTIVAAEADWPDARHVDAYVRGESQPAHPPRPFRRFPTWMWRNQEIRALVDWMREHDRSVPMAARKAGFYGLDLYGLSASMDAVVDHLARADPSAAAAARRRYACLASHRDDLASGAAGAAGPCEAEAVLDAMSGRAAESDPAAFDALMNARGVAAAERYSRAIGSASAWNLRDRHMFDTLLAVLEDRGPAAKAVVWAHNSHVGDASATEMGRRGETNLGELCRRHFGDRATLVGFGTDRGAVMAASHWGAPPEIKTVRSSLPGSYGAVFREARADPFLLDLRGGVHEALRRVLAPERLDRAIGVMYLPTSERVSHYFETSLPAQFDAFAFFRETRAVTPIPAGAGSGLPASHPLAG